MSDGSSPAHPGSPPASSPATADDKRPSRLGRGLSSLMGSAVSVTPTAPPPAPIADPTALPELGRVEVPRGTSREAVSTERADLELVWLDLAQVSPNPHQPRTHFDRDKLRELADSIKTHGVMQPVVVRPRKLGMGQIGSEPGVEGFELIAGERRWRAAQLAGIPALPAIIRDLDEEASAELALVENLQREDLNPIERAEALQKLHDRFQLTHEQIGEKVGLKRSSVSNLLRLLELDPAIRARVAAGELSMGHARALLGCASAEVQRAVGELFDEMGGMTVRQVEEAVRFENAAMSGEESQLPRWYPVHRAAGSGSGTATRAPGPPDGKAGGKSDWIQELERQMATALSTKVSIRPGRKAGTGTLTIQYHSLDDFDELLAMLGVRLD